MVAELRNCSSNVPEVLGQGVKWAIEAAGEKARQETGEDYLKLWVNGGTELFRLTNDTKVIIEVVPCNSPRAYLLFSTDNRFGYYKEGDNLLIVVRGNAPRALFRAILGLQLDRMYHVGNPDDPEGSQIAMPVWDTIDRQPLMELWNLKRLREDYYIDDILLSPDSLPVGVRCPS